MGSNPTLSATLSLRYALHCAGLTCLLGTVLSKAVLLTPTELQQLPPDRWLRESLAYFRDLGFFSTFSRLDLDAFVDRIAAQHGVPFDPTSPLADLNLLSYDPLTLWTGDMEDCGDKEGYYARSLAGWGKISRGALQPQEIVEDFGHARNIPTLLWFRQNGKRFVVIADHTDDSQWGLWLDLSVFDQLNIIMDATNYEYVLFKHPFQDASVLCLTREEQAMLKRDRAWRFLFDADDDETEEEFLTRFGVE